jgi:hypothetical protein
MMCPTRGRPDRVMDMLRSFYATRSPGTEIILITCDADPKLETYKTVLHGEEHLIFRSDIITKKQNYVVRELYPDLPYYGSVNDDHLFRTVGWDAKLIAAIEDRGRGFGLACGSDLFNPSWYEYKHPSGHIISGNIVRTLGYFDYPEFKQFGIDHWLAELFWELELLYYVPEVVIEHMHVHVGKGKDDTNYQENYTPQAQAEGHAILDRWRREQKSKDVYNLRELIRVKQQINV